jgi:hypothetical protein
VGNDIAFPPAPLYIISLLPQNTPSVPSGVKSWAQASVTHGAHGDGECRAGWETVSRHFTISKVSLNFWLNLDPHNSFSLAHDQV